MPWLMAIRQMPRPSRSLPLLSMHSLSESYLSAGFPRLKPLVVENHSFFGQHAEKP